MYFAALRGLGRAIQRNSQTVQFSVELENWLLENVHQSYVVPEDFTQYRKLVRPTAKGISVYLYVWFYASDGKEVEKDYSELCVLLNVRCYQHFPRSKKLWGCLWTTLAVVGYLKTWDVKPMVSKKVFKLVMSPGREILHVRISPSGRAFGRSRCSVQSPPSCTFPQLPDLRRSEVCQTHLRSPALFKVYRPIKLL